MIALRFGLSRVWSHRIRRFALIAAAAAALLLLSGYEVNALQMSDGVEESVDAAMAGFVIPSVDGIQLIFRLVGLGALALGLKHTLTARRAAIVFGAALILITFVLSAHS